MATTPLHAWEWFTAAVRPDPLAAAGQLDPIEVVALTIVESAATVNTR